MDDKQESHDFWHYEKEKCYFCNGLDEAKSKIHTDTTTTASAAASKAAKEKADEDATKGMPWIDVYMMYYRVVFEHEYRRRSYMKQEETMNRLLEQWKEPEDACPYHEENIAWYKGWDKTVDHEKVQKEFRIKFERSKWPNPLTYNETGRNTTNTTTHKPDPSVEKPHGFFLNPSLRLWIFLVFYFV